MYFSRLVEIAENRVNKYGAQYSAFAIFGLINYPISYLYTLSRSANKEELYFRVICIFLSLALFFKDNWPEALKRYLPIYWYLTLIITLPMFATFMLLIEKFSLNWLVNFNLGVMTLIFLLDSLTFLIITFLGIGFGIIAFYSLGISFTYNLSGEGLNLFIYMFLCIVIVGSIFTRNKEIFNYYLQKNKDDLNKSLEKKVKDRTAELERALAAKSEFLNNMSHEIRTPVSGFTIISEGLVDNWDILSEEKKKKYANDISDSAKRLGSLISNILDLSTFITNKMYLNYRRFNFVELINEVIEEIKILYKDEQEMNISFKSKQDLYLTADKEWMARVLRHLFSNAIKFSKEKVNITLILDIQDHSLHFLIADTGVGVPESEMNEIFTPFTQSSRTKTRAGGRGLGLAICKEIIEAHKGKIWVENNIKQGATFHFLVPINEE